MKRTITMSALLGTLMWSGTQYVNDYSVLFQPSGARAQENQHGSNASHKELFYAERKPANFDKYKTWEKKEDFTAGGEQPKKSASLERQISLDPSYYFNERDLEKYHRWIRATIRHSSRYKTSAIIIDKANYSLDVYNNGKLVDTFPVELGCDPIEDKMMEGDCATPEGMYKVKRIRNHGQTAFYRALLIDYPNRMDWKEFRQAKNDGIIPPDATIGGLIEVHGHGSGHAGNNGGHNWTFGCIALSNEQMDEIFKYAKTNMPITIVKYGTRM